MGRKDRKMIYKTPEEVERSRVACLLVTETLTEVGKA
jgi:methionyl aminopeptidase